MAATLTPASARVSSPPRVQTAREQRVDTVGRRDDEPSVLGELGQVELHRLDDDRGQLDDIGSELAEARPKSTRLFTGARHDDPPAEQGTGLEPREVERGHRSDHDRRGRLDRFARDPRERAADRVLAGVRPPPHGRHRRVGRAAAVDEPARDLLDAPRAHEHDDRAAGAGERVPVGVGRALRGVLVAGDDRDVRRQAPVGDGNARVGGRGDRAGDTGHHFERHARGAQRLGLLTTTAEHEGIAALEPDDGRAGATALDEQGVDLGLRHRNPPRRLAHVDPLGGRGREVEQPGVGEPVVDHDLRARQQLRAAHGQEAGITGTRADEIDGHDERRIFQ